MKGTVDIRWVITPTQQRLVACLRAERTGSDTAIVAGRFNVDGGDLIRMAFFDVSGRLLRMKCRGWKDASRRCGRERGAKN